MSRSAMDWSRDDSKFCLADFLDLFVGKTIDEQEKNYIKKYGYPNEDVVFSDRWGRCSKIIGLNTYKKAIELGEKIKIKWKNNLMIIR